jgi:hypothetical protein
VFVERSTLRDLAYEQWKRERGLDRRGFPNLPVLPSESKAAAIANASAKSGEDDVDA